MQRRHNFPVPPVMQSQNPASTEQPAPETTVPDHQYEQTVSSDIGGTSDVNFGYTYMDLDTPETDAIQLDISTDLNFDSLVEDSDDLPPQPLPFSTLLDPPTPCLDERPSPVFQLHFRLWWQTPPIFRAVHVSLKWPKRSLRPQIPCPAPRLNCRLQFSRYSPSPIP